MRSHHGSIARAQRVEVEDLLKAGALRALVATSSLELGIDMGAIDLVVQIEAPPSVASGLQRIGRGGHQANAVSEGVIFPKFRGDLVASAAVAKAMHDGAVEATRYPRNPLDIVAQQVVAMVSMDTWDADELFATIRRAAPFAELSRTVFDGVLDMLSGRYPSDEFAELRPRVTWDRLKGTITAREGAKRVAIANGGTIPDRGLYGVFLVGSELDAGAGRRARRRARRGNGVREPRRRDVRARRLVVAHRGDHARSRARVAGARRAGQDAVLERRPRGTAARARAGDRPPDARPDAADAGRRRAPADARSRSGRPRRREPAASTCAIRSPRRARFPMPARSSSSACATSSATGGSACCRRAADAFMRRGRWRRRRRFAKIAHGEQASVAAQEDATVRDGGRGDEAHAEIVAGQDLGGSSGLDHDGLACLADEIHLAIGRDRGGKEHAVESRLPDALACFHVGARQHADIVGQIQQPLVGDHRRDVGSAAGRAPDDMTCRHVAASARAQREVRAVAISAGHVDEAVVKHRRRDRRLTRGVRKPQQGAGGRIVPVDALARVDEELVAARGRDDQRRAVRGTTLAAVCLPPLLTRARVERDHVRRRLVIAEQDQQVPVEHRRAAVSPVDVERRVLFAEMLRPHDTATHVEGHELTGAEPGEDTLAVGDGCRRRQVVLLVERGKRPSRLEAVLPEAAALRSIEGFDDEHDGGGGVGWLCAAAANRSLARDQRGIITRQHRVRAAAQGQPPDLRRDEDLIAPDDRRRRSKATERGAPRHVLALAPCRREIGFGRDAMPGRPAPLRPVRRHRRAAEQDGERDQSTPHRSAYQHIPSEPPRRGVRYRNRLYCAPSERLSQTAPRGDRSRAVGVVRRCALPDYERGFRTRSLGDWIDPYFINYLQEHWRHSLLTLSSPASPSMFFPAPRTLGYSHGLVLYAPFYLAARLFFHPFQADSLALLLVIETGIICLYVFFRKILSLSFVESLLLTVFFVTSQNVVNGFIGVWSQRASVFLVPPVLLLAFTSARMPPGRLRTVCAALSGLLATLMYTQDFYSAHFALLFAILSIVPAAFFMSPPLWERAAGAWKAQPSSAARTALRLPSR